MIYLLRHGEIDLQGQKVMVGQTDLPLSETGVCQAEQWREEFVGIGFDKIYCSDLKRSQETAQIIGMNRRERIRVRPELREMNLGEWEGFSRDRIKVCFPGEWERRGQDFESYRPPGGESFGDLAKRVVPIFEEILRHSDKDVLIVGHAGVNRVILCHVLGIPLANLFRFSQDYASLNIIQYEDGAGKVVLMNRPPLRSEG
ncbi:MAG: alpha-ribazole phosphatase [Deltaproteobacteria bacterium]|nr:alpha-ribazole phosphatase [Deltaproteobacteria bacterium]